MTAGRGEIRGRLDRVSSVTKTFTHVNGVHTELELWIGGKTGKWHLPVEVELMTPGATYALEYNERDRDNNLISDPITVPGAYTASLKRAASPHRLKDVSSNGAVISCRY